MSRLIRGVGYVLVGWGVAGLALGTTFHSAFGAIACGVCLLYLWPTNENPRGQ